jgi:hypothetical protein
MYVSIQTMDMDGYGLFVTNGMGHGPRADVEESLAHTLPAATPIPSAADHPHQGLPPAYLGADHSRSEGHNPVAPAYLERGPRRLED